MRPIKDFLTRVFKSKENSNKPWLDYYSEEERKIKFTDKGIYEYLVECVGEDKDFIALNYFGNRISFNELFDKVEQASKAFKTLGVKPGDIVTICMPNTPETLIAFYALNNIGAVADMVHPLSSSEEIKYYLSENKSRVLVLYDGSYEKLKDVIPESLVYKTIMVSANNSMPTGLSVGYTLTRGWKIKKPSFDSDYISWNDFMLRGLTYTKSYKYNVKSDDLAVVLHSGGTTGRSKGIMISNFNFNAEAQQGTTVVYDVRPKDSIVTVLPNFHGFGLCVCMHAPLCLKVEVILMPEYDAKRYLDIIKKNRPNILVGVPTLWEGLMKNPDYEGVDLSSLKYVISGGDYLSIPMEMKFNDFLHTHGATISITKGYGMTESVAASAFTYPGTNELGSIGIPLPGNTFCICDPETEEELPIGEQGEICVMSPAMMQGYLNNKEETDHVIRKHKDGRVWLHTGDIGYISPNGVVFFTNRLKRMIVSSGFNVYPNMIEEAIEKHPAVQKCCVVGIPHPYKMHVAKAFIVLKNGEKETTKIRNEIKELCKKELAVYSVPKEYEFRNELPKTLYNKVDYKSLEKEETEKYENKTKKEDK